MRTSRSSPIPSRTFGRVASSSAVAAAVMLSACNPTQRHAGVSTLVKFPSPEDTTVSLYNSKWNADPSGSSASQSRTRDVNPVFGDSIQFPTDVLTMQVLDVYIDSVPSTLTGSQDIVVFAEVWENGASYLDHDNSLTSIVGVSRNQLVPGRLNLSGRVVYGPTEFKGYPLTVRFTVMVLQKEKGVQGGAAVEILSSFANFIPLYGQIASTALKAVKQALLAQPDVIAFDYEMTFLAENPETHQQTSKTSLPALPAGAEGADVPQPAPSTTYSTSNREGQPRATWQSVWPWLRYDVYAIVETRKRYASLTDPDSDEQKRRLSLTPQLRQIASTLAVDSKNPKGSVLSDEMTQSHPHASHILFSITPGQLPLERQEITAASASAEKFLKGIQQEDRNIDVAIKELNSLTEEIKLAVYTERLEKAARALSKQDISVEGFNKALENELKKITGNNVPSDDHRIAEQAKNAVESKWSIVYGVLKRPEKVTEAQQAQIDTDRHRKTAAANDKQSLDALAGIEAKQIEIENAFKAASAAGLSPEILREVKETATKAHNEATTLAGAAFVAVASSRMEATAALIAARKAEETASQLRADAKVKDTAQAYKDALAATQAAKAAGPFAKEADESATAAEGRKAEITTLLGKIQNTFDLIQKIGTKQ
jgi:hypothetical protein